MAKKAAAHRTRKPSAAWQGQLTFGLITFPVRALTGAREDKISFNQICPTHRCRTQAPTICPGGPVTYALAELPGKYLMELEKVVKLVDAKRLAGFLLFAIAVWAVILYRAPG